jgi:hypothetical protein
MEQKSQQIDSSEKSHPHTHPQVKFKTPIQNHQVLGGRRVFK